MSNKRYTIYGNSNDLDGIQEAIDILNEYEKLNKKLEELELELDSTNSTLKKYADKLIRIAHLHDHYLEYDYREFDKLLEEALYDE